MHHYAVVAMAETIVLLKKDLGQAEVELAGAQQRILALEKELEAGKGADRKGRSNGKHHQESQKQDAEGEGRE